MHSDPIADAVVLVIVVLIGVVPFSFQSNIAVVILVVVVLM